MQPMAIRLAVPMPNSSAPSMAAMTMSRPVFRPPSGAQPHAVAQLVQRQDLMHLRQPHLPGQAGELDRGLRAGAGAAGVAGDQDDVGVRFGDARGDGADARPADQLHRDLGVRIDLLQVIDELGQILDRIDVVVRRRADQGHARRGVAQPRDHLRHLEAGQLPALAGLGALGDLDLQLAALVQVLGGDAEAARRHLLDGGVPVVAVLVGTEARRILAALARVGLGADAVHRDVQRGRAPRATARPIDMPGVMKRLRIAVDALDLVDRDGGLGGAELQQVAQLHRRPLVHLLGILLEGGVAVVGDGLLEGVDDARPPSHGGRPTCGSGRSRRPAAAAPRRHRRARAAPAPSSGCRSGRCRRCG